MHAWQIKLRSIARKTGGISVINRFRRQGVYEKAVREVLASSAKCGDVIWDVGANVGIYTELFCQWVGKDGAVVAFEPLIDSCARIHERLPDCTWLQVKNVALGDQDTEGVLLTTEDSTVNHLATRKDEATADGAVAVQVRRGDTVFEELGFVPNVLKVDVEGFEEEVFEGMPRLLASPELRSVLVEVHFEKLEMRGKSMAPRHIESLLKRNGFKTRWVASSHLFATR